MTHIISVAGLVATTPRHIITQDGLPITSFRLASDIITEPNNEQATNWYTVTAFRTLALNVNTSINKGDRIVVTGSLVIRDWDNGERTGTSVELVASSIGHDLAWGTSVFTRTVLVQDTK
jgi:single-strand DNA-binding protein